jgi:uncharacterized protein
VNSLPFSTHNPALDEALLALGPAVLAACDGADAAHDAQHVVRVTRNAVTLCERESLDPTVAVTAAWLHELFNYPKGHPDSRRSGEVCGERAEALLAEHRWSPSVIASVRYAIAVHPFSLKITPEDPAARVLQDADRLDAIGAIGAARCFATCASMGRPFYDLDDPWAESRALDDKLWGVDHFAVKLLGLADGMHTASARAMAAGRVSFLRGFLAQMRSEIAGE